MTQEQFRDIMGGSPELTPLNDGTAWANYSRITGHDVSYGVGRKPDYITSNLRVGNRVVAHLNTETPIGHEVVVKSSITKIIVKAGQEPYRRVVFKIMDPAIGATIRISYESISKASHYFFIAPLL